MARYPLRVSILLGAVTTNDRKEDGEKNAVENEAAEMENPRPPTVTTIPLSTMAAATATAGTRNLRVTSA